MEKQQFEQMDGNLKLYLKIAGACLLSILTIFFVVKTVNEVKTYSTIGHDPVADAAHTITVPGHGEVLATPDLATFTWTVSATDKNIAGSQGDAAVKSNAAIAYLKQQGVKDEDIKTTNYSTYEQYQDQAVPCAVPLNGPMEAPQSANGSGGSVSGPAAPAPDVIVCPPSYNSKLVGYTTTETVEVKIHGVKQGDARIGTLLSGIGGFGVKPSDVSFSFDDPTGLQAQARALAIANARSDAEALAKDLGVDLGPVVGYSENNYGGYPMAYGAMARSSANAVAAPQIPVGQNTVTSDVSVTYSIK